MNARPSTAILALASQETGDGTARSLRGRFFVIAGIVAIILLGSIAFVGLALLKRTMAGDEDAHIANAATLSKSLVDRVLSERSRKVDLIASAQSVLAAARTG